MTDKHMQLLRLMHLVSPSLPTGAYAYSQGLEWAIADGWIQDGPSLRVWLADLLQHTVAYVDIPLLSRMHAACRYRNDTALAIWCNQLLALRETHELRLEEKTRGRAMLKLLEGLHVQLSITMQTIIADSQLAGYAMAAAHWNIELCDAATGYVWSWLENQVLTGIKTIPLGQTEGHQMLHSLGPDVIDAVAHGLRLHDDSIGASSPALAIASSCHETQYTRLYRS
ncbi:MAG: urease accessory protein UreF [Desulfatitalea sp. BRH_c12]|nr:MAG: urease accessory protein UreF [Desulfatitalea sp. BRH_c12]